jgi:hypothetical protein
MVSGWAVGKAATADFAFGLVELAVAEVIAIGSEC